MKPLVDWFCCSFKSIENFDDFLSYFFLNKEAFKVATARNNYQFGLWFNGISIWYNINKNEFENGYDLYDICISMSGTGCRSYETLRGNKFDWQEFIININKGFKPTYFHFSRVDIALDVLDDSVPEMIKIIKAVEEEKYVSKFRRVVTGHCAEEWVYFGSPESDTRLRIYNKALERKYPIGFKWVRFEYQLRNESAGRFIYHLSTCKELGQAFKDFINESVSFTKKVNNHGKDNNHHSDRLVKSSWWKEFVKGAGKIQRLETPGIEYNYTYAEKYLNNQVAPTLAAYIEANNSDLTPLLEMVERNKERMNDKQKNMIKNTKIDNYIGQEKTIDSDHLEKLKQYEKLRKELFGN